MSHRSAARIALVAAFVIALALVPTGLAGKGGGGGGKPGGTGTISLVLLNSTDGLAHYGQKVTFAVSTTATSQPWVIAKCYQNGTLVYEQAAGIFPTSLGQVFTLGPTPAWSGGGADCTASLQNWSGRKPATLATLNFDVYA
jgi:hypothetical protein